MDHTYKIGLIGGTGKVGRHIAAEAIQKGYQVRMLVRNPERVIVKDENIEIVKGHVQDKTIIRELLQDCNAVINTFGQPAKEKPIYSDVTKSILDVMDELNIRRYIGVSGGSLTLNSDKKSLVNRFGAKIFALLYPALLKDKELEWNVLENYKHIDWTLIRLPFVRDSLESKTVIENPTDMPGTKISNIDIASFIIDHLRNPAYVHQTPFISH